MQPSVAMSEKDEPRQNPWVNSNHDGIYGPKLLETSFLGSYTYQKPKQTCFVGKSRGSVEFWYLRQCQRRYIPVWLLIPAAVVVNLKQGANGARHVIRLP